MKQIKKRMVSSIIVKIDDEAAKQKITEVRINVPGELDVYEKCPTTFGFIQRLFSLPISFDLTNDDCDKLLEYAKNNIPDEIIFGL